MAKILLIWASADWSIIDVSNGYKNALTALGHEVKDFRLSQRIDFWSESLNHWGEIHGHTAPPVDAILKEASDWALIEAAYFKPDLVLITCGMGFHPNAMVHLTQHGYRTALILTESPYDDDQHEHIAPFVNYVFTNDRHSFSRLRVANPRTFYLPTAFDHTVHHPSAMRDYLANPDNGPLEHPNCDVLFVGTGFGERETFLGSVDWKGLGVDFQLYGFWGWAGSDVDPRAEQNRANVTSRQRRSLAKYVHEPITNDETAARYGGAKIVLNFYRDGSAYSMNPRAYEIAACGAFQLAQDSSKEAHLIFGDTIDYFNTPAELESKIQYWLDPANEQERVRRADLSRSRILSHHSYADRSLQLLYSIAEFEERFLSIIAQPVSLSTGQDLPYGSRVLYPRGQVGGG